MVLITALLMFEAKLGEGGKQLTYTRCWWFLPPREWRPGVQDVEASAFLTRPHCTWAHNAEVTWKFTEFWAPGIGLWAFPEACLREGISCLHIESSEGELFSS